MENNAKVREEIIRELKEQSYLNHGEKLKYRYDVLSDIEVLIIRRLEMIISDWEEIYNGGVFDELDDESRGIALEEQEEKAKACRDILKHLENFR